MSILKRGLRGEPVRRLQGKLGVDADGIFGERTEAALKRYQTREELAVDGIAGPDTFAHMGLFELVLLKRGTRGEMVKKLQAELGLRADGIFGLGTERAVVAFQSRYDLEPDGLAGPATLAQLNVLDGFTEETVAASQITEETVRQVEAIEARAAEQDAEPSGFQALTELGASLWSTVMGAALPQK